MGSFITRTKDENVETPGRESVLKRIEDPRSPTDYISRTPIEVTEKKPKESTRHLAFANALKEQNKTVYESSPIYPKSEKYDKESIKLKYPFAAALNNIPNSPIDDSDNSLNISAIEKENK